MTTAAAAPAAAVVVIMSSLIWHADIFIKSTRNWFIVV